MTMKNLPLTAAAIKHIKGSGFWTDASEKRLKTLAKNLANAGVEDINIAAAMRELWSIAQAEYGE